MTGPAIFATRLAGLMVMAIGLAHFVMPTMGYDADTLAAIPGPQRDHFVYLGTYAIGSFLVAFGIMTLAAAGSHCSREATLFLGLMTAVWGGRLALELLYPVDLPLFFVAYPHPLLLATVVLIWLGYIAGFADCLRAAVQHRGAPS